MCEIIVPMVHSPYQGRLDAEETCCAAKHHATCVSQNASFIIWYNSRNVVGRYLYVLSRHPLPRRGAHTMQMGVRWLLVADTQQSGQLSCG